MLELVPEFDAELEAEFKAGTKAVVRIVFEAELELELELEEAIELELKPEPTTICNGVEEEESTPTFEDKLPIALLSTKSTFFFFRIASLLFLSVSATIVLRSKSKTK